MLSIEKNGQKSPATAEQSADFADLKHAVTVGVEEVEQLFFECLMQIIAVVFAKLRDTFNQRECFCGI